MDTGKKSPRRLDITQTLAVAKWLEGNAVSIHNKPLTAISRLATSALGFEVCEASVAHIAGGAKVALGRAPRAPGSTDRVRELAAYVRNLSRQCGYEPEAGLVALARGVAAQEPAQEKDLA